MVLFPSKFSPHPITSWSFSMISGIWPLKSSAGTVPVWVVSPIINTVAMFFFHFFLLFVSNYTCFCFFLQVQVFVVSFFLVFCFHFSYPFFFLLVWRFAVVMIIQQAGFLFPLASQENRRKALARAQKRKQGRCILERRSCRLRRSVLEILHFWDRAERRSQKSRKISKKNAPESLSIQGWSRFAQAEKPGQSLL